MSVCHHSIITKMFYAIPSPNKFEFPHSNFHDNKLESCDKPECRRVYCYVCKTHLGGNYSKEEQRK